MGSIPGQSSSCRAAEAPGLGTNTRRSQARAFWWPAQLVVLCCRPPSVHQPTSASTAPAARPSCQRQSRACGRAPTRHCLQLVGAAVAEVRVGVEGPLQRGGSRVVTVVTRHAANPPAVGSTSRCLTSMQESWACGRSRRAEGETCREHGRAGAEVCQQSVGRALSLAQGWRSPSKVRQWPTNACGTAASRCHAARQQHRGCTAIAVSWLAS